MCANHHTVIDDDEAAYTVQHLREIKAAHEAKSASIADGGATAAATLFVQPFTDIGQTGGFSEHTVHSETINVQSAPSASHVTQRQMQAFEDLWEAVRKLRNEFGLVVFVDDVLTRSELDAYFRGGEHAGCLLHSRVCGHGLCIS
jgi:hypothetical protein